MDVKSSVWPTLQHAVRQTGPNRHFLKYADVMGLVAYLPGTNALFKYHHAVDNMVKKTFSEISLELNITKTKELCCGGSQNPLFSNLSVSSVSW